MKSTIWMGLAAALVAVTLVGRAEEATKKPVGSATPPAAAKVALGDPVKGKVIFEQYCALCHGVTGKGDGQGAVALPPPKPRDFTNKAEMDKITNEQMIKIITEGGAAVGKSIFMASWKAVLKEDQIKDVAAYARTFAK